MSKVLNSRETPVVAPPRDAVLTKAALRAAARLKLNQVDLAQILGVSPSVISRLATGGDLPGSGKSRELAALFVRVFRSLDAIVGGDEAVAAKWLRAFNTALGQEPLAAMKTIPGLIATLTYLDSRRAVV